MTAETVLTEEQLIRQATDALIDNLGIMEATRFLTLKHQGRLESVERRRVWQHSLGWVYEQSVSGALSGGGFVRAYIRFIQ